VDCFETVDSKVKWFAAPPLDVVADSIVVSSLEYAHAKVLKEQEKAKSKGKVDAKSVDPMVIDSTETLKKDAAKNANVDWKPLTKTLETLANIWLKEADSIHNRIVS
jgi:hypothetical protein